MPLKKLNSSLISTATKSEIIRDYSQSSKLPSDAEKAMWGSNESMLNRFRLGLEVIDWRPVSHWMDIGCGTGRFFRLVEAAQGAFIRLTGVDITPALIEIAQSYTYASDINFIQEDFESIPTSKSAVDLLTIVGVLQLCGCPIDRAIRKCSSFIKPGGQLFLTTKHAGWSDFKIGGVEPEENHSWFSLNDIKDAIDAADISITEVGGFLPREGRRVPASESHTIFIRGIKNR